MAFRRKKKTSQSQPPQDTDSGSGPETSLVDNPDGIAPEEVAPEEVAAEPETPGTVEFDRGSGPFDSSEADDEQERLDLGGLQIPVMDELQVQVDVDPRNQEPGAVTLILGQGAVQVRPYSAPRSGELWEEVRSDIKEQVLGGGDQVEEIVGEFGVELQATVEAKDDNGEKTTQTLRFVGIEGPRWMLQGTFFGEGTDPLTAGPLNAVYRSVVVVRGDEAMPAKQPLVISVPESDDASAVAQDGVMRDDDGYQLPVSSIQEEDEYDRSSGPYDVAEAEVDPDRLDLGSLQIPFVEDLEISVDVDEDTDETMAVTLIHGEGAVQVRPFSAPGSFRIWDEARAEIKAGVSSDGGLVDEVLGEFGPELRVHVSAEDEDGKSFVQPIRFVGVNGPGWMLQGVFLGEGTDPESAAGLESIFRSLVVDATTEVVEAGHPLPLTSPQDLPDDLVQILDDTSEEQE